MFDKEIIDPAVACLILGGVFGYVALKVLFRGDPLPEKQPRCVWHSKVAKLERVYDGDTFFCFIKGHNTIVNKPVGVRIRGIDTTELKGTAGSVKAKAEMAKALAENALKNARVIHLYNLNLEDKYGRVLADVFCDGTDLAKLLLSKGVAKPYQGGKKMGWGK